MEIMRIFFLSTKKTKDLEKLKEDFYNCLKLSKIDIEMKFQLPFIGYDLSLNLLKNSKKEEAKEIIKYIENLIPESYINFKIKNINKKL